MNVHPLPRIHRLVAPWADEGARAGPLRLCGRPNRDRRGAPLCLSVSLSLLPPLSLCQPLCLSASLPPCLSACLPASLPPCLPASLPLCLPPCLSASLPPCLPPSLSSVPPRLPLCLSLSASLSLSLSLCLFLSVRAGARLSLRAPLLFTVTPGCVHAVPTAERSRPQPTVYLCIHVAPIFHAY
jgi:hypothetical protein